MYQNPPEIAYTCGHTASQLLAWVGNTTTGY